MTQNKMNLLGIRRIQEGKTAGKKLKRKGHRKTEVIGVFLVIDLCERECQKKRKILIQ